MTVATADLLPGERLRGLTEAEARARHARGEGNVAPVETSRSYIRILRENAFTAVNTILFAIAVALLALRLFGDAIMTAGLVLANVVVGVVQETRAKRQLDRIALLTRPRATVVRDGREREVDPAEIVRGDLLVVRPGDQILVDGTVLAATGLSVDESLLTGESDLVPKQAGDRVYSGSFCMVGSGAYEATHVGTAGTAQQLTARARAYRDPKTPLQREVGWVVRVVAVATVALGIQVAGAYRHVYTDLPVAEIVRAAAVIVALVPQGLVFMVTVTYALAAVRMAGKGALIQRMNAVESTSHVDVLCLDKTGTLTTNAQRLHALHALGIDETELRRLLGAYAASTGAGNRTVEAIARACPAQARPVRQEAPFSSTHKWSALALDGAAPDVLVLGAPEVLRPALATDADIDGPTRQWTVQGLRVLLLARAPVGAALLGPDGQPHLPTGLTPLGLVSLADELRPEARETIQRFGEAGIALKIISGDHPETVAALARQAGFPGDARVRSGAELGATDGDALEAITEQTSVFGRITPEQKERLVRALRRRGHYVAMVGDGVNDVLALKQAHLAIALRSGSQVTRSVADIVLLDDSFGALPAAFREGQRILRGMQDIIRLFLVRTLYVALIILGASLTTDRFPITPKHSAVMALLTVGIPTLALAAWAQPGTTPRRLVPSAGRFVVPAALGIAAVALAMYHFFLSTTGDVAMARTALTTTTVLCGVTLIPFAQPPNEAWTGGSPLNGDWRPVALALAMLALYGLILALPGVRHFYELALLPLSGYVIIALVVVGWAVSLRFFWRLQVDRRLRALLRRPPA
jgi:cation-transporting ATPase E